METEILRINDIITEIDKIERAGKLLAKGNLVAIPTETVYGLAANALDEKAVAAIFIAKGRPQDNPLIVHISEIDYLEKLCEDVPESAYKLANAFWPGPLTMVLKKRDIIPEIVTAGMDTVGIRFPSGNVARAIIYAAGVPLAAPSANLSGKPSPTKAEHVIKDLNGKVAAIVDGGSCSVGVESTVIDMTRTPPVLLRPGGITLKQLKEVLGYVCVDKAITSEISGDEPVRAPGMKYRHYAPKAPVTILNGSALSVTKYIKEHSKSRRVALLCFEEELPFYKDCGAITISYGREREPRELARGLFDSLRRTDELNLDEIFAREPETGEGIELAVVNRLEKAAGFNRIILSE